VFLNREESLHIFNQVTTAIRFTWALEQSIAKKEAPQWLHRADWGPGYFQADDFERPLLKNIEELPRFRNMMAHPKHFNMVTPPRSPLSAFQLLTDIVSRLWPGDSQEG
jgi:hypothetical protein